MDQRDKDELKKEILEKVKQYYNVAHKPGQDAEYVRGETKVNYSGRVYDSDELVNLVSSSLDFWLTAGPYASDLQGKLAEFFGVHKAYLVNSGSSANLIIISVLRSKQYRNQLHPGDEVITPAVTFPTTLTPIVQNGLIPVFVDCELATYNIDASQVEAAIGEKTKAIFVPHTLGNPVDLDILQDIADRKRLVLIEDCCDAFGATFDGKPVGSFGVMSSLSFYPAHQMTMGEGGAVIVNEPELARIALSIRDWGRDCWCEPGSNDTCGNRFNFQYGDLPFGDDHKYVYSNLGYNLKVTDMQAAIGVAQFEKINGFVDARRDNFNFYYENLKDLEEFLILPKWSDKANPSWFGFPLTVREGVDFDKLICSLEGVKIETRKVFAGNILKHPGFKGIANRVHGTLENTDIIMNRAFFIGVYPGLKPAMRQFVLERIRAFFGK